MLHPVQSVFAAGLLLTLAFSVNDGSAVSVPAGPEDSLVQLTCDQDDYGAFAASDPSAPPVSRCGGALQR